MKVKQHVKTNINNEVQKETNIALIQTLPNHETGEEPAGGSTEMKPCTDKPTACVGLTFVPVRVTKHDSLWSMGP